MGNDKIGWHGTTILSVRANGKVVSGERTGWFRRSQSTEIRPGDTIIVPLDTERVRALPLWQAVTTIIYNLTLGIYAIRHFCASSIHSE